MKDKITKCVFIGSKDWSELHDECVYVELNEKGKELVEERNYHLQDIEEKGGILTIIPIQTLVSSFRSKK